jgi:hypothetical protein
MLLLVPIVLKSSVEALARLAGRFGAVSQVSHEGLLSGVSRLGDPDHRGRAPLDILVGSGPTGN